MLIVKVTMPTPAAPSTSAHVTTEAGFPEWYIPITTKLTKRMKSYDAQFFFADTRPDGSVRLGNYAPWQPWA